MIAKLRLTLLLRHTTELCPNYNLFLLKKEYIFFSNTKEFHDCLPTSHTNLLILNLAIMYCLDVLKCKLQCTPAMEIAHKI